MNIHVHDIVGQIGAIGEEYVCKREKREKVPGVIMADTVVDPYLGT